MRSPDPISDPATPRPLLIRFLSGLGYAVAAVVVTVEDWVWEAVGFLSRLVGRLAFVRRVESLLSSASPPMALAAFAVPVLLVEPAKLIAFALIAQGRFLPGILLLALSYGVGTVLLVRVWTVCKPALMTYRIIAWSVDWLARFRAALHQWLRQFEMWRRLAAWRLVIKEWGRDWIRQFYRK